MPIFYLMQDVQHVHQFVAPNTSLISYFLGLLKRIPSASSGFSKEAEGYD